MRFLTFAAGLGVMYYFDPERGRIRRALLAGRARRLSRKFRHGAKAQFKRVRNRFRGITANVQYQLASAPVDDEQLNAQVRSRLGRLVGHPGSIHTAVRDGRLRLRGPILSGELHNLMASLWDLNGIKFIDNQLRVRESPGREPGLQGTPRSRRLNRNRISPLAIAGGVALCGFLSDSRPVRVGALYTATLFFAAGTYQRLLRSRRMDQQETMREPNAPLDYRPFVDAADEATQIRTSRKTRPS